MLFLQPRSLKEAQAALSKYGDEAKVIAGGTAVVLMLQQNLIAPRVLVSLGDVPALDFVREDEDGLHIGALTSLDDVVASPPIRQHCPALARACGLVGNVRVRNQATLGGNLAEADYASDPPAVLLALDARVTVGGPNGSRSIPVAEFILGFFTTALAADELVTDIHIPAPAAGTRSTYLKYVSRSSEDRPCVGVAVVFTQQEGVCTDLRVAVGAACETPQRLTQVEALAIGQTLSAELIDEVAASYADRVDPLDDLRGSAWYRRQMIRVHVKRALEEVGNVNR